MRFIGTICKFSIPFCEGGKGRNHIANVQIMRIESVERYEEILNLYICRRMDNGQVVLAFAEDLSLR